MLIHPCIEIHDLCLYIPKERTLVIGDLHFGFEESLNKQGVLIPRQQFKEAYLKIEKLLEKLSPRKVILVGDIKHEFARISNQEWNNISRVIKLIKTSAEVVLIKGNHDTILEPIATQEKVAVVDSYALGNMQFLHGDIIKKPLGKIIIIGHEHPAISFRERPTERFKCFLKGKYKTSTLIVMPSFNILSEGSDITQKHFLSPFLKSSRIEGFEVWIIQNKVYYFGKVGNIQ